MVADSVGGGFVVEIAIVNLDHLLNTDTSTLNFQLLRFCVNFYVHIACLCCCIVQIVTWLSVKIMLKTETVTSDYI